MKLQELKKQMQEALVNKVCQQKKKTDVLIIAIAQIVTVQSGYDTIRLLRQNFMPLFEILFRKLC